MPPRLRLFYSVLTGVLLLIPALALYRDLSGPADIWWTPPAMAITLAESQDRVQIYARGRPLGAVLDAKQLWIKDEAGSGPLGAHEIGLRLNNWDRVRAARLPALSGRRHLRPAPVGPSARARHRRGSMAHPTDAGRPGAARRDRVHPHDQPGPGSL